MSRLLFGFKIQFITAWLLLRGVPIGEVMATIRIRVEKWELLTTSDGGE